MTDKAKVCDKAESEYLDKTFPHEEKGTWYDITEMPTSCDVNDSCEDCPRYRDGHANYSPPYVDEEYFCKDGERREP